MDKDVVESVLTDWRSAPIDDRLRAILGYLEKLTLTPEQLCKDDVVPLYAAGLSNAAIFDAGYVCFIFSVIDRLADAFDFDIPSDDLVENNGRFLHRFGYSTIKYLP